MFENSINDKPFLNQGYQFIFRYIEQIFKSKNTKVKKLSTFLTTRPTTTGQEIIQAAHYQGSYSLQWTWTR